jgi:hypothetical protein
MYSLLVQGMILCPPPKCLQILIQMPRPQLQSPKHNPSESIVCLSTSLTVFLLVCQRNPSLSPCLPLSQPLLLSSSGQSPVLRLAHSLWSGLGLLLSTLVMLLWCTEDKILELYPPCVIPRDFVCHCGCEMAWHSILPLFLKHTAINSSGHVLLASWNSL